MGLVVSLTRSGQCRSLVSLGLSFEGRRDGSIVMTICQLGICRGGSGCLPQPLATTPSGRPKGQYYRLDGVRGILKTDGGEVVWEEKNGTCSDLSPARQVAYNRYDSHKLRY